MSHLLNQSGEMLFSCTLNTDTSTANEGALLQSLSTAILSFMCQLTLAMHWHHVAMPLHGETARGCITRSLHSHDCQTSKASQGAQREGRDGRLQNAAR